MKVGDWVYTLNRKKQRLGIFQISKVRPDTIEVNWAHTYGRDGYCACGCGEPRWTRASSLEAALLLGPGDEK